MEPEKMTVISVKGPGHIVGAFSSRGRQKAPEAAIDVAGEAIEIRDPATGGVHVRIPVDQLEVKAVDLDVNVLREPRRYVMANDIPTLESDPLIAGQGLTLSATDIAATFTAPTAPAKRKVWVRVEADPPGPEPLRIVKFKETDQGTATFPQQLPPGNYRWLLLVDDFLPKSGIQALV